MRDGRLYARGVSDDKGPMLIPIEVAEAFFAMAGRLPVNVKFMFEGEEEIGSRHLDAFVTEHKALLAADVVVSADGAMWRIDEPSLTVASRGLCGLELDAHRGVEGSALGPSRRRRGQSAARDGAAHRLAARAGRTRRGRRLLRRGARAVAGGARGDRRAAVRRARVPGAGRRAVGVRRAGLHDARAPVDAADARGQRHVGRLPGTRAEDRDPERGAREDHLPAGAGSGSGRRAGASGAAPRDPCAAGHAPVAVPRGSRLACGSMSPRTTSRCRRPDRALQATYGVRPLVVRMGGTVPIAELFQRHMGLDTVFFSFSTADEDFHAPNEFFRVHRLHEGLEAWARYWDILGEASADDARDDDPDLRGDAGSRRPRRASRRTARR